MSAAEHSEVEHVATIHPLPSRTTPDPEPPAVPAASGLPVPHMPSMSQVADLIVPPDIWSDDRPSLRKLWLYSVYGRWTRADGVVRVLGALYATVISMPVHAATYLGLWIVERPSRFLVAATVVALTILAF